MTSRQQPHDVQPAATEPQPVDPPPLSERMASAARDLEGQDDPAATYRMATQLALVNVDGCEAAGLSLVRGRRTVENRAATSAPVVAADELQTSLGEGPCLEAIWEHHTIYSPSLAFDRRWPAWGPAVVRETGFHSALSFQLYTHADTVGALNLYSTERDAFTADEHADGLVLAAHVAIAVSAADKIDNLGAALATRTEIGQATGILVDRFGLRPEAAFSTLARISATDQVKLRVLAAELVSTGGVRGHPELGSWSAARSPDG